MVHAVVIGAGGGIGRAVVADLAATGATLSLVDVVPEALAEAAAAARSAGCPDVATLLLDPASDRGAEQLDCWLAGRADALDRLVYAAGVTGPVAPIGSYGGSEFAEVVRVNLQGPFLVLSHLLHRLLRGTAPAVVMVGSTSAIRGRAGLSGYVASKHGLLGLVRSAAMDLADGPVRLNAVLPGPVDTPMLDALETAAAEAAKGFGRSAAGTRIATAADVADTIGFLLSERARHVRGAAWVVDGGITLG